MSKYKSRKGMTSNSTMNQLIKEKIDIQDKIISRKKELELQKQEERDGKLAEIFKNLIRKN